jgi:hypothetical protein
LYLLEFVFSLLTLSDPFMSPLPHFLPAVPHNAAAAGLGCERVRERERETERERDRDREREREKERERETDWPAPVTTVVLPLRCQGSASQGFQGCSKS